MDNNEIANQMIELGLDKKLNTRILKRISRITDDIDNLEYLLTLIKPDLKYQLLTPNSESPTIWTQFFNLKKLFLLIDSKL